MGGPATVSGVRLLATVAHVGSWCAVVVIAPVVGIAIIVGSLTVSGFVVAVVLTVRAIGVRIAGRTGPVPAVEALGSVVRARGHE
jgi:hypothetical protein